MEIPYSQKVRNECHDYHYFFHYKRDRTEELKDTTAFEKNNGSIETGYAHRMLEEQEKEEAKILARVMDEEKWRQIRMNQVVEEKRQQRQEDKRRRMAELQAQQEEREMILKSPKKETRMDSYNNVKFASQESIRTTPVKSTSILRNNNQSRPGTTLTIEEEPTIISSIGSPKP